MVTEALQEVPIRHVGPVFVHSCTLFAKHFLKIWRQRPNHRFLSPRCKIG